VGPQKDAEVHFHESAPYRIPVRPLTTVGMLRAGVPLTGCGTPALDGGRLRGQRRTAHPP